MPKCFPVSHAWVVVEVRGRIVSHWLDTAQLDFRSERHEKREVKGTEEGDMERKGIFSAQVAEEGKD